MSTAEPGWYSDPEGTAGLRFWDGGQWTADVRPSPTPAGAGGAGAEKVARRFRPWPHGAVLVGGVAAVIAVVAISLSATGGRAGRHPRPTTPVTGLGAQATGDKPVCLKRPRPATVVELLAAGAVLSTPASRPATPPPGACLSATFADRRAAGTNTVSSYPTSTAAAAAAAKAKDKTLTFAEGLYVMSVVPGLRPDATAIRDQLAVFASQQFAYTGSPPTLAPGTPTP